MKHKDAAQTRLKELAIGPHHQISRIKPGTLFVVFESDEHHPVVLTGSPETVSDIGKDAIDHFGLFGQQILLDLFNRVGRLLDCRALWQFDHGHKHALIFRRQERRRQTVVDPIRAKSDKNQYHHHTERPHGQPPDNRTIATRQTVKAAIEPAQRQQSFLVMVRFEKLRAHRRRQDQGDEKR